MTVARELAARRHGRIIVVESGPDAGREHYRWVNDADEANRLWLAPGSDPHFWRPYQSADSSFLGLAGLRRRVGGRSLYWHGVTVPIDDWALRDRGWPESVVSDLTRTWDGGPCLNDRIQSRIAAWAGRGPLSAGRRVRLGGREFVEAPRAVRDHEDGHRWRAYSPLDDWTRASEIYPGSHVVSVLEADGVVTGVEVSQHDQRMIIHSPNVVLAAGTVENSRLVIQALTAAGALAVPQLTGLADKIAQGLVAAFDPASLPADLRDVARTGGLLVCLGDKELRSSVFLRTYVNKHGLAVVDCYCLGEHLPGAAGRVWCEPAPGYPWRTFVECGMSAADELLVQRQRAELRSLFGYLCQAAGRDGGAAQFDEVFGSEDLPRRLMAGDGFTAPGGPVSYSFPLGSEQHEAGTLPLGGPIVDERSQVRAIRGLFPAGPCTFPRAGAANPAVTIMALSMRLACSLRW